MPPYHWMISSRPRPAPRGRVPLARVKGVFQEVDLWTLVGDLFVPHYFTATAIREDEGDYPFRLQSPTLLLELKMKGSQPLITEFRITPLYPLDQESEPEELAISSALLRELPLGRLARHAMLGVAIRVTSEGELGDWAVPPQAKDEDGYWYIDALDSFTTPSNEETRREGLLLREDSPPQFKSLPWQQDLEQLSAALHQAINARDTARNRISDEHLQDVARVYREAIDDLIPPKKAVSSAFHVSISTAGRWVGKARERGLLGPTLPGKKGELDTSDDEHETELS